MHIVMKNIVLLFMTFSVLLVKCTERATKTSSSVIKAKLNALLNEKEFFKLEQQLNSSKDSIDDDQRLYFQAFLDNAFNRNEASVRTIDTLLNDYSSSLTDSSKAALQLLQGDCYFKLFQYAKAAQCDSLILGSYAKSLDSNQVNDIKNDLLIRNALRFIAPQRTSITRNTNIQWTRDEIGLIEIPVKHDTTTYSCIFDTRANISSISKTYAIKLGLKMLDVSYDEGSGITGIKFKTGLGIADSLYIGDILIRNVVFQVMPDSTLYIAPVNFSLNVIIGFPVINQLREIHIFKDGWMIIPQLETASELHNFALNGLDPVISLLTDKDTLCFNFDLGATTTDFYYAFFEKYKQRILKEGRKTIAQFGGAGGVLKKEVYVMPHTELFLGNKKVVLDSTDVLTQEIFPGEKMYGNIGNDFTSQFSELVLNFDKMYIKGN
jgi:hypothetical protein